MKNNVLVKDSRYEGKYMAMESFKNRKILASGNVAEKVYERARKKGASSPVIFYVPKQTETNIFWSGSEITSKGYTTVGRCSPALGSICSRTLGFFRSVQANGSYP